MATRKQIERKQQVQRIVAWGLAVLLIGGAVFSSIVGMVHFE